MNFFENFGKKITNKEPEQPSRTEQIKEHRVIKKYLCLCHGSLPKKEDTLTLYMRKLEDKKISLVIARFF